MASIEATTYLGTVKWGDEGHYLREFAQKFKLPQAAKIIKGQYQTLGVPNLPSSTLNQIVFIASAGIRVKVVAQCIKFKDAGRKTVTVGPKLTIPENYDGWFEILSEDGRSARCIESVLELARKGPRSCLLRDSLKVNLPRPDDADDVWDKTRTLSSGDVLTVGEIVTKDVSKSVNKGCKFLKCATSVGDTVYLPLELKCKFSCIAGEENISGVHSVKNIMIKRYPLTVRLVHGKPPVGVKLGSQFVPEMRLYSLVEEESLMAMPLLKDTTVIPLPTNAPIKILAPKNGDHLLKLREHEVLADKCRTFVNEVTDCLQICDFRSVREIKQVPQYSYNKRQTPTSYKTIPLVKRSASDPQGATTFCRMHLERGLSIPDDSSLGKNEHKEGSDVEDYRYEEIDQIYDYVRGFAPLPANIKNEFLSLKEEKYQSLPQIATASENIASTPKKPPDPPPIETIPARRHSNDTIKTFQVPHKITVNIVNRTHRFKNKAATTHNSNQKLAKLSDDHVYEKIDKNKNGVKTVKVLGPAVHGPLRSASATKIMQQSNLNANGNKPYHKTYIPNLNQHVNSRAQNQQIITKKFRFLKHSKNSPLSSKETVDNNNKHSIGKNTRYKDDVKNLTTSPLFHIRYKSLTDLLTEDATKISPDSSYESFGKKVDGFGGSFSSTSSTEGPAGPEDTPDDDSGPKSIGTTKNPLLSRPKSLCNLVNDINRPRKRMSTHNAYNLVQNDLIRIPDVTNPKFYSIPDATKYSKNHFNSAAHLKKLGTLYL